MSTDSTSTKPPAVLAAAVAIDTTGAVLLPPPVAGTRPTPSEITAWILIAIGLGFVMIEHLVWGVVAGLALYLILDRLSTSLSRRISSAAARPLALVFVTLIGSAIVVGVIALLISFLRQHAGNVPAMMTKMADILTSTRARLGSYGEDLIPDVLTDAENFKGAIVDWLKSHADALKLAGGSASMALVHMLMGMLLAVLVFFRHVTHHEHPTGPLARALTDNVARFSRAFAQIAAAQIKISAVNTSLTAIYLLVGLPLFGRHLPFSTTIILVTFVCGLIPVLGNLISNTVIVVLSLGLSIGVAIASLVFLILVHKLEYIINSRIVGGRTNSQAWEILLAILVGETAFGVAGVVMAPIIYAYLKGELRSRNLV